MLFFRVKIHSCIRDGYAKINSVFVKICLNLAGIIIGLVSKKVSGFDAILINRADDRFKLRGSGGGTLIVSGLGSVEFGAFVGYISDAMGEKNSFCRGFCVQKA